MLSYEEALKIAREKTPGFRILYSHEYKDCFGFHITSLTKEESDSGKYYGDVSEITINKETGELEINPMLEFLLAFFEDDYEKALKTEKKIDD